MALERVEYRYYIDREEGGVSGIAELEAVLEYAGALEGVRLRPSSTTVLSLRPVVLDTRVMTTTTTSYDGLGNRTTDTSTEKTREDDLRGVWIRIYGPPVEGASSYRDVTYPSDLARKVKWTPPAAK